MDEADAQLLRRPRPARAHGLSVEQNLPLVRGDDAAEHLHQRRLARAVLADEYVHLARAQVEIHPVEYPDRRVPERVSVGVEDVLRDALHFQQNVFHEAHLLQLPVLVDFEYDREEYHDAHRRLV